jgi:hypothetical protein
MPATRGRWIPMKIVDHFAATLATWFGAGATQLATVFPKLSSLGQGTLGFI